MRIQNYLHIYIASGLSILPLFLAGFTYLPILLVAYILFMPLVDIYWKGVKWLSAISTRAILLWVSCILCIAFLAELDSQRWLFVLTTLVFAALPEEWFYRGYLQTKFGNNYSAIILVSVFFSMAHVFSISWIAGVLVFIPSLIFGYIYKKSQDLIFVVLLHTLSNLAYKLYIFDLIEEFLSL